MKWTVSISVIRISRQFAFNWRVMIFISPEKHFLRAWSFRISDGSQLSWASECILIATGRHRMQHLVWFTSDLLQLDLPKALDTTAGTRGLSWGELWNSGIQPVPVKIQNTRNLKFIIRGISRNNIDLAKYSTRKNRNHK